MPDHNKDFVNKKVTGKETLFDYMKEQGNFFMKINLPIRLFAMGMESFYMAMD